MADTPNIRFKGFTDAWEQRKLGEVAAKIGSGKTPLGGKSVYVDSGIALIRSQNINDNKVDLSDVVFIDDKMNSSMENSQVYRNDVLLNITGASIGRSAVYKDFEPANVNQHVCIIRPIEGYSSEFIQLNLVSDNGQRQIESSQVGGGREGLNFQQIGKMDFQFPSKNEQDQIGLYFTNLDHLITLHQRKCEETKELKKYMLQKMFPKNGEKIPEIRFAGFTDDWQQRKLGDVAEYSKGNGYSKSDLTEVGTPIILYGRLYTKYQFVIDDVDTFSEVKSGAVFSRGNEVIVPASGETAEDIARASAVVKSGILLGGDLNILRPFAFINPLFLALAISNGESQKELAKKAQGKSVVHIHNSDIQEIEILYPERAEQNRIVEVFCNLDHLITLHQRKYDDLKEVKKFMLQNMFPKKG